MEHLLAAIRELEEKIVAGHVDEKDAKEAIESLRTTHERLNRIEETLGAKRPQP